MGLVTTAAFQYPLWIKARASVLLSVVASSEIDEDLTYQMLTGFRRVLPEAAIVNDVRSVLALLHCVARLLPQVKTTSIWTRPIVWLAIILLGTTTGSFFNEVTQLLTTAIEVLQKSGSFGDCMIEVLMDSYKMHDTPEQSIEQFLSLSFDLDFSFSVAWILFKGVRPKHTSAHARRALESMIQMTIQCNRRDPSWDGNEELRPMHPDVLGYFIAMLPFVTTTEEYEKLCSLVDAGSPYPPEHGLGSQNNGGHQRPDAQTTPPA